MGINMVTGLSLRKINGSIIVDKIVHTIATKIADDEFFLSILNPAFTCITILD
jgi:hypothetical protein